jgi:hypothetical protein
MAKKALILDYTVYSPHHQPGEVCWDFRTLKKAKSFARGLGSASRIYRNFNLESRRGKGPHDWWSSKFYWAWNGHEFVRKIDSSIRWADRESDCRRCSESVTLPPSA